MSRVFGILAFVAVLAFLQCRGTTARKRDSMFLVQRPTDNKLVVVIKYWIDGAKFCSIFTEPELVEDVKKYAAETGSEVVHPTVEEMEEVSKQCDTSLERKRGGAEDRDLEEKYGLLGGVPKNEESRAWGLIYPGTKWCGAGDEALNDDDLGDYEDTDRCCRAHDKCNDIMAAGETKNNITNESYFTRLSCECDDDFYECLKTNDDETSYSVGEWYFNFLGSQCYKEDHPLECKKYRTFLEDSCLEYEIDTSKPKVYQWVDAKSFK